MLGIKPRVQVWWVNTTTEAYHQPIKQNGVQLSICYQKLIE